MRRALKGGSLPFDSAAGYYDRTRVTSPEAEAAQVAQLTAEIRGRPTLEVGVGTGRIGRPLRNAGVDLVGLDLSRPMLARLVAHEDGRRPFGLVEGDCTRLPFPDGAFGAVLAAHVFHVVTDWAVAVAEAERVLEPGGVLLATRGGWQGLKQDVATHFTEETGTGKPPVVGLDDNDDLDAHLGERGVGVRHLDVIVDRQTVTLDDVISVLERGQVWVWDMDEDVLLEAGRRTRVWAEETYGDLHERREQVSRMQWRAYDF